MNCVKKEKRKKKKEKRKKKKAKGCQLTAFRFF